MTVAVTPWPGALPRWGAEVPVNEVLVISVEHTDGVTREQARERIRACVREALAQALGIGIERIAIESTPGSAPRLAIVGWTSTPGLSISHAGALSMAAINPNGAVGLDLMEVQVTSDWARVAHDYLGMAAACRLAASPDNERPLAFAQAWAEREACLKLHGEPLAEWAPLQDCRLLALDLPAGLAGALALEP
jgi:4'-phosphopantetheinyl transferase